MKDSLDTSAEGQIVHESCGDFHGPESGTPRAGFDGPLQDAPGESTAIAHGLSQQLIHQMNLISDNILVSFDDLNVDIGDAVFPMVQAPAKAALQAAIQERGIKLSVNSAYRTLAQQMLLYNWYHGRSAVALPGESNHQGGLAIDIEDPQGWLPYLERHGWRWLGDFDPPHFDYVGGGTKEIRSTAILAFQQLWNKNYTDKTIDEDSGFGDQTEGALQQSPVSGFAKAPWDDKPRVLRLSRPRMEGSDVLKLQEKLKTAGFTVDLDGVFGPGMDKVVREFQTQKQLIADGLVGAKTFATLG
jgi:N-acetylmuramoyl-L-alanine amidase